jgi:hypothetical protein
MTCLVKDMYSYMYLNLSQYRPANRLLFLINTSDMNMQQEET